MRVPRSRPVQKFRMLYFEESLLQATEEVRVRDVLEAIEKASAKPAHQRVEIWRAGRRVAEVGMSLGWVSDLETAAVARN